MAAVLAQDQAQLSQAANIIATKKYRKDLVQYESDKAQYEKEKIQYEKDVAVEKAAFDKQLKQEQESEKKEEEAFNKKQQDAFNKNAAEVIQLKNAEIAYAKKYAYASTASTITKRIASGSISYSNFSKDKMVQKAMSQYKAANPYKPPPAPSYSKPQRRGIGTGYNPQTAYIEAYNKKMYKSIGVVGVNWAAAGAAMKQADLVKSRGGSGSEINRARGKAEYLWSGGSQLQWTQLIMAEDQNRRNALMQSAGLRASGAAQISASQQTELKRLGGTYDTATGKYSSPTKVSSRLGSSGKIASLSVSGTAVKAQYFPTSFQYKGKIVETAPVIVTGIGTTSDPFVAQQPDKSLVSKYISSYKPSIYKTQFTTPTLTTIEPTRIDKIQTQQQVQQNVTSTFAQPLSVKNPNVPRYISSPFIPMAIGGASLISPTKYVVNVKGKDITFKSKTSAQKYISRLPQTEQIGSNIGFISGKPIIGAPAPEWQIKTIDGFKTFKTEKAAQSFIDENPRKISTTTTLYTLGGKAYEVDARQFSNQRDERSEFILKKFDDLGRWLDKSREEAPKGSVQEGLTYFGTALYSQGAGIINLAMDAEDWIQKNVPITQKAGSFGIEIRTQEITKKQEREALFMPKTALGEYASGAIEQHTEQIPKGEINLDPTKGKGAQQATTYWNKLSLAAQIGEGSGEIVPLIATGGVGFLKALSPVALVKESVVIGGKTVSRLTPKLIVPTAVKTLAKPIPIRYVATPIKTDAGKTIFTSKGLAFGYDRAQIRLVSKYGEAGQGKYFVGKPEFEKSGIRQLGRTEPESSYDVYQLSHYSKAQLKELKPLLQQGEDAGIFPKGNLELALAERDIVQKLYKLESKIVKYQKTLNPEAKMNLDLTKESIRRTDILIQKQLFTYQKQSGFRSATDMFVAKPVVIKESGGKLSSMYVKDVPISQKSLGILGKIHPAMKEKESWLKLQSAQKQKYLGQIKGSQLPNILKGSIKVKGKDVDIPALGEKGTKAQELIIEAGAKDPYILGKMGTADVGIGLKGEPFWSFKDIKKAGYVHGTNLQSAKNIEKAGIDLSQTAKGRFFVTENPSVTKTFSKKFDGTPAKVAIELDESRVFPYSKWSKAEQDALSNTDYKIFQTNIQKAVEKYNVKYGTKYGAAEKPYHSTRADSKLKEVWAWDESVVKNVENITPTGYKLKEGKEVFNIVTSKDELKSQIAGANVESFYGKVNPSKTVKIGIDDTKKSVEFQSWSKQVENWVGASGQIISKESIKRNYPELAAKMFKEGETAGVGYSLPFRTKDTVRKYFWGMRETARMAWQGGEKEFARDIGKAMKGEYEKSKNYIDWRKEIAASKQDATLEIVKPKLKGASPTSADRIIIAASSKTPALIVSATVDDALSNINFGSREPQIARPKMWESPTTIQPPKQTVSKISTSKTIQPRTSINESVSAYSKPSSARSLSPPKSVSLESPSIVSPKSSVIKSPLSSKSPVLKSPSSTSPVLKSPSSTSPVLKSPTSPSSPVLKSPTSPKSPILKSPTSPISPLSPKSPISPKSPVLKSPKSGRTVKSIGVRVIKSPLSKKKPVAALIFNLRNTEYERKKKPKKQKDFLGNTRTDRFVGLINRKEILVGDKLTQKQVYRDKRLVLDPKKKKLSPFKKAKRKLGFKKSKGFRF